MKLFIYTTISILIIFLNYRVAFSRGMGISLGISLFILIHNVRAYPYETIVYISFINTVPFITDRFKKDFDACKKLMRARFEKVKSSYTELLKKDRDVIESNLEMEKRLQHILSLYEISKDMSTCLLFEDIFSIFSSVLKKSFRFRISRVLLLRDSKDIEGAYNIETGRRIHKVAPDNFDRELAAIAVETKKTVSLSSQEGDVSLRRLSVIKDFESLISVPLFVEGTIAGVLYIENIPRMYFDNFMILSSQLAIHFQKVMLYKKVQEMSITDSLTGVRNRRYFLDRFKEELRRSMRHKSSVSLLMLDLDHFKEKNDRFGHLVGDVILKKVADMLTSDIRAIDVIARYGEEKFSILMSGIDRKEALRVSERIRLNIEEAIFKAYDETVTTTVSIGISVFPDNGVDVEGLIESADRALYKAKETGRNRIC